jgi:IclR family transcriptional regulator, pca regulon regulatory protein
VLGIREIAEMLGMSPATAYRYASTLVSDGYLERDDQSKYRLGLGAVDLGMAALNAMGLCVHARPALQELARRSGYEAQLAVLDGPEVLLVAAARGTRRGQGEHGSDVRAGSRLPAYCTSLGKALLAFLGSDQRLKLISEMELRKRGPHTITSASKLTSQLDDVRDEGLAIDDEELAKGSCSIAAPVRDESGDVIAAVSVVTRNRAIELHELESRFAGPLMASAERISARLGYRGEGE